MNKNDGQGTPLLFHQGLQPKGCSHLYLGWVFSSNCYSLETLAGAPGGVFRHGPSVSEHHQFDNQD